MFPRIAGQRSLCHSSSVGTSYAELSRFVGTRRHGITSSSQIAVRCLSSSNVRRQIELPEASKKALDGFRAAVREEFGSIPSQLSQGLLEREIGNQVTIAGYLGTRRNVSKKLTFALLRNPTQDYCVQLVSFLGKGDKDDHNKALAHDTLKSLKDWTPVVVTGTVNSRSQPSRESTAMDVPLANTVEVGLHSIEVLNEVPNELLLKDDTAFSPEQRHLQLRTDADLRGNVLFRSTVTRHARKILEDMDFTEIETPILFKSTPEGAREFLVPTRTKGLAYALPQSPQQYKQILMASGITKYFQFARCFRDEDPRADRQPEFTQLDMEMSFLAEKDVMLRIEQLLGKLWEQCLCQTVETPFQRMTYQEAMGSYGSDKPDLRLGMEIHSITEKLPKDLIRKVSGLENPVINAFKMELSGDPKVTRGFISDFLDSPEGQPFLANRDGKPGVFVGDAAAPMKGLGALGYDFVMDAPHELAVDHGDLLILQARKNKPFSGGSTMLGSLRLALHKAAVAQGLIAKLEGFRFVWIVDFPLFTPSNDTDPGQGGMAGFSSTHHPFTAPKTAQDVDLLLAAPEKAVAAHYDIVVNGVELGGGSRRIHNAEVQEFIFKDVLKMPPERIEDFRHLLGVLRSGCPPHAGIALGWDRLIAVMRGKESVRDVIAFPKSGRGEDMLVKSPNKVTREQLDTYHLRLRQ